MRLRLRALKEALKLQRQHVVEVGANNRGPIVDKIIKYAGGDLGEAYCVDTMIWAYGHAGSRFVKPGFTRAVRYMNARGVRPLSKVRNARPGDLLRFVFDHTGMLIGWRRLVWVRGRARFIPCPASLATHAMTVEGNTGPDDVGNDAAGPAAGVHVRYRPIELLRDALRVYG